MNNEEEFDFYIFKKYSVHEKKTKSINIDQRKNCYAILMNNLQPYMNRLSCSIWSDFFNSIIDEEEEWTKIYNMKLEELEEKYNESDLPKNAPNVLLALSNVDFWPNKLQKYWKEVPLLIHCDDKDHKDDSSDAKVNEYWYVNKCLASSDKQEFIIDFLKWIGTDILKLSDDDVENIMSQYKIDPHYGQNVIIYGAPGTGKSYWVDHYAQNSDSLPRLKIDEEKITRVVFHPEYTYFDFVGQYRPCMVYKKSKAINWTDIGGNLKGNYPGEPYIDYRFVPGPFTNVLVDALKDPDNMYTILIEELNRADAAAVFGDVFQLLDRNKDGESEYSIEPSEEWLNFFEEALAYCEDKLNDIKGKGVRIPYNMNIIATMNSADQGVHLLDTAFKRRWRYKYISVKQAITKIKKPEEENFYNTAKIIFKTKNDKKKPGEYLWLDFIDAINEKIAKEPFHIPEDRWIGPYFATEQELNENNGEAAIEKVLFYLWDDVLRNSDDRKSFFADDINSLGDMIDEIGGKSNDEGREKGYKKKIVIKNLTINGDSQ